jgi:hypothetical protein
MKFSRAFSALTLAAFILPVAGAVAFEGTSKKTGHQAVIDKDRDGSKKLEAKTNKKTARTKRAALIDKDKDGSKKLGAAKDFEGTSK